MMLEVGNLTVRSSNAKLLLEQISVQVAAEEIIGLTGASGSGKTTLIKQILGIPDSGYQRIQGTVTIDGKSTEGFSQKQWRQLRGSILGYIPQSPMTAFDTRLTIGNQMTETFRTKRQMCKQDAFQLAGEVLAKVNLTDPTRVLCSRPGELSGGMLQRVAFAILLGLRVKYVLADEPTSALDEENRDLLLSLLREHQQEMGVLFVSHDAHALQMLCSSLYIMERGRIVEQGETQRVFQHPQREWTKKFVDAGNRPGRKEWSWREYT